MRSNDFLEPKRCENLSPYGPDSTLTTAARFAASRWDQHPFRMLDRPGLYRELSSVERAADMLVQLDDSASSGGWWLWWYDGHAESARPWLAPVLEAINTDTARMIHILANTTWAAIQERTWKDNRRSTDNEAAVIPGLPPELSYLDYKLKFMSDTEEWFPGWALQQPDIPPQLAAELRELLDPSPERLARLKRERREFLGG